MSLFVVLFNTELQIQRNYKFSYISQEMLCEHECYVTLCEDRVRQMCLC